MGHVTCQLMVSAWCLLLSLNRIIFHLDITDGTCYVLVRGFCYCQLLFPT